MLALSDDKNVYYNASKISNSSSLIVKLYRNFDGEVMQYTQNTFDGLADWIRIHTKPYIAPFNRDLLRKIFTDFVPGVVFFNTNRDK